MTEFARVQEPARKLDEETLEVEQAALVCVINNSRAALDAAVAEGLRREHFLAPQHADLWDDISEIVGEGAAPSSFALIQRVGEKRGKDLKLYIAKLKTSIIFTTHRDAPFLARSVIDFSMRRDVAAEANAVIAGLGRDGVDVPKAINALSTRLAEIGTRRGGSGHVTAGEAALAAIETVEKTRSGEMIRTKSGFADVDRKLGGFNPGRLYILGGRPSMGKTSLALWMAWNVARSGVPVIIFSLEMTADELSMRWLSGLTDIELEAMNAGTIDHNDVSRMVGAKVELDALPITIDDRPGLSLPEIQGLARRFLRGKPRGLVIIDHLGLISTPGREDASRVERTADVSNGLKALAKNLAQPVLALAQLNRANEQRDDRRPQLSDLRWAGELEQDADCIAFVHREAYYIERQRPKRKPNQSADDHTIALGEWTAALDEARGVADVIIAKNRNGGVANIDVAFDARTARFSDLSRDA